MRGEAIDGNRLGSISELCFAVLAGPLWVVTILGLAAVRPDTYQLDFYKEVGPLVWTAIVVNVLVTVAAAYSSRRVAGFAYANLTAIFLATLAIPWAIGYFAYGRYDNLTLIGSIAGTMRTGQVRADNLYPGTDFVANALGVAGGLPAPTVFYLLGLVTSGLLLMVLCLFIRNMMPGERPPGVYTPAFVFYCGWIQVTAIPNFVALGMAGVLLYVVAALPAHGVRRLVVMLLLGTAVVLGHPFVTAFIVVALVALWIIGDRHLKVDLGIVAVVVFVALVLWSILNPGLSKAFVTNWRAFQENWTTPVSSKAAVKADRLGLSGLQWVQFTILYFLRYLLPMFAIPIMAAFLSRRERASITARTAWTLLVVGAIVQVGLVFNPLISHTFIRAANINYMIFGMVPLFAVGLAVLARRGTWHAGVASALAVLLIAVTILGAFDSPRTFQPNQEFGNEDVLGARWLTTDRGNYSIYNPLGTFEYRSMGLLYDVVPKENPLRPTQTGLIGDHFSDYPWGRPLYLAVPKNDVVRYPDLYPNIGRFTQHDFDGLLTKTALARVYDTQGFAAYYYHPS